MMLSVERNIGFFHLRGSLHLGVACILFGRHRSEGVYLRCSAPSWLRRLTG